MTRVSPGTGTALTANDVEIGAVEIKNATDDTRATVGANGLYVDVRNFAAALPTGTNVIGAVTQSGTWNIGTLTSITNSVTVDSELPAAAALADTTSNPTTPLVGAAIELFNGTTWDRVRGDTTNGIDVDVTRVTGNVTVVQSTATNLKVDASGVAVPVTDNSGSLTVDNNGTFAVQAAQSGTWNIGTLTSITNQVDTNLKQVGSSNTLITAHATDSAGSGSAAVGLLGEYDDVAPTSITENQFGHLRISANRNLYVTLRDAAGNERGVNIDANNNLGAVLASETTKVLGTVRTADGSGNLLTSTGNALDVNLKTSSITLNVSAAQSGNWTSRIVGNAGATLDSTVGAGTAPTNQVVVGAIYNSTEISPTTGQSFALQADAKGRLRNVIMDAAGNTRGVNVNASNQLSVSVDNTPAVSQSGTWNIGTLTSITNAVTVSQATASNLNAQVVGAGAQNAAVTGNPVLLSGYASAAEPTNAGADGRAQYPWLDLKGRVIIAQQAGTGTLTNVSSSASSTTLLSANTARKSYKIYNDSTQVCYVKYGTTASPTSFSYILNPGDLYDSDDGYSGRIDAIWASANGNARVTEIT